MIARPKLIIYGAAEQGLVVADAIVATGDYALLGFVDRNDSRDEILGIAPFLGSDENLPGIVEELRIDAIVVAIGDNHVRQIVMQRIGASLPSTVSFPAIVHPAATVGFKAALGEGSVVLVGAVIGPGAQVGEGCIINTCASLDHHGVLGDYASLAPGVTCGGNVSIGEGSAISIGATVLHGRSVGSWSVVGAGAVVIDDVPDGVVAYGTPARVVRNREPCDRYL